MTYPDANPDALREAVREGLAQVRPAPPPPPPELAKEGRVFDIKRDGFAALAVGWVAVCLAILGAILAVGVPRVRRWCPLVPDTVDDLRLATDYRSPDAPFSRLLALSNQRLLLASLGRGLHLYRTDSGQQGVWRQYTTATTRGGLPGDDVTDLHGRAEEVWVAADGALARTDQELRDWRRLIGRDGFKPVNQADITAARLTSDGRLLVIGARSAGVGVYDTGEHNWQTLDKAGGSLFDDRISALALDDHGLWVGTAQGVNAFMRNERREPGQPYYTRVQAWELPDLPVARLSSAGSLTWAMGRNGGLFARGSTLGAGWQEMIGEQGFAANLTPGDLVDVWLQDHRLWLISRSAGVGVYDTVAHRWQRPAFVNPYSTPARQLTPPSTIEAAYWGQDTGWLATSDGLFRWEEREQQWALAADSLTEGLAGVWGEGSDILFTTAYGTLGRFTPGANQWVYLTSNERFGPQNGPVQANAGVAFEQRWWAALDGVGVAVYDSSVRQWSVLNDGLPSHTVSDLRVLNGALYALVKDRDNRQALYRLTDKRWSQVSRATDDVQDFTGDGQRIWYTDAQGTLVRFDDPAWTDHLRATTVLPSEMRDAVQVGGAVYVGTQSQGLIGYEFEKHNWFTTGITTSTVTRLTGDTDSLWLVHDGGGLTRYRDQQAAAVVANQGLGGRDFQPHTAESLGDAVYIGHAAGVARYRPDQHDWLDMSAGLPKDGEVRALRASANHLWALVASEQQGPRVYASTATGWQGVSASATQVIGLTTYSGEALGVTAGGSVEQYSPPEGQRTPRSYFNGQPPADWRQLKLATPDAAGRVWMVTQAGQVSVYATTTRNWLDLGRVAEARAALAVPSTTITQTVVIATATGLVVYTATDQAIRQTATELSGLDVRAVTADREALWALTGSPTPLSPAQLWRRPFDASQWQLVINPQATLMGPVTAVHAEGQARVLLGTAAGQVVAYSLADHARVPIAGPYRGRVRELAVAGGAHWALVDLDSGGSRAYADSGQVIDRLDVKRIADHPEGLFLLTQAGQVGFLAPGESRPRLLGEWLQRDDHWLSRFIRWLQDRMDAPTATTLLTTPAVDITATEQALWVATDRVVWKLEVEAGARRARLSRQWPLPATAAPHTITHLAVEQGNLYACLSTSRALLLLDSGWVEVAACPTPTVAAGPVRWRQGQAGWEGELLGAGQVALPLWESGGQFEHDRLFAMAGDRDGVWVATGAGLVHYRSAGQGVVLEQAVQLPGLAHTLTPQGGTVCTQADQQVFCLDAPTGQWHPAQDAPSLATPRVVFTDPLTGTRWLSGPSGAEMDVPTGLAASGQLASDHILGIEVDGDTLWLRADSGVWEARLQNYQVTLVAWHSDDATAQQVQARARSRPRTTLTTTPSDPWRWERETDAVTGLDTLAIRLRRDAEVSRQFDPVLGRFTDDYIQVACRYGAWLWLGTRGGVWQASVSPTGLRWERWHRLSDRPIQELRVLDGQLYAMTDDQHVFVYREGEAQWQPTADDTLGEGVILSSEPVLGPLFSRRAGQLDTGRLVAQRGQTRFAFDQIADLDSYAGQVWLATVGGVATYTPTFQPARFEAGDLAQARHLAVAETVFVEVVGEAEARRYYRWGDAGWSQGAQEDTPFKPTPKALTTTGPATWFGQNGRVSVSVGGLPVQWRRGKFDYDFVQQGVFYDGALWLATAGPMIRTRGESTPSDEDQAVVAGLGGSGISQLAVGPDARLYAREAGGKVFVLDGSQTGWQDAPEGRDKFLQRVVTLEGRQWSTSLAPDMPPSPRLRVPGSRLLTAGGKFGFDSVQAIAPQAKTWWLATVDGVARWEAEGGRVEFDRVYTAAEGLPGQVIEDGMTQGDSVWMQSNGQVYEFTPAADRWEARPGRTPLATDVRVSLGQRGWRDLTGPPGLSGGLGEVMTVEAQAVPRVEARQPLVLSGLPSDYPLFEPTGKFSFDYVQGVWSNGEQLWLATRGGVVLGYLKADDHLIIAAIFTPSQGLCSYNIWRAHAEPNQAWGIVDDQMSPRQVRPWTERCGPSTLTPAMDTELPTTPFTTPLHLASQQGLVLSEYGETWGALTESQTWWEGWQRGDALTPLVDWVDEAQTVWLLTSQALVAVDKEALACRFSDQVQRGQAMRPMVTPVPPSATPTPLAAAPRPGAIPSVSATATSPRTATGAIPPPSTRIPAVTLTVVPTVTRTRTATLLPTWTRTATSTPTYTRTATPSVTPTAPLPTGTSTPTATPRPPAPPTATPVLLVCPGPNGVITSPLPGAQVSGTVFVQGTAREPNFQFYKVEYQAVARFDPWHSLSEVHPASVINGTLDVWNTGLLRPGDYWLRLTVVDKTGNYPASNVCSVRVTVR